MKNIPKVFKSPIPYVAALFGPIVTFAVPTYMTGALQVLNWTFKLPNAIYSALTGFEPSAITSIVLLSVYYFTLAAVIVHCRRK